MEECEISAELTAGVVRKERGGQTEPCPAPGPQSVKVVSDAPWRALGTDPQRGHLEGAGRMTRLTAAWCSRPAHGAPLSDQVPLHPK